MASRNTKKRAQPLLDKEENEKPAKSKRSKPIDRALSLSSCGLSVPSAPKLPADDKRTTRDEDKLETAKSTEDKTTQAQKTTQTEQKRKETETGKLRLRAVNIGSGKGHVGPKCKFKKLADWAAVPGLSPPRAE